MQAHELAYAEQPESGPQLLDPGALAVSASWRDSNPMRESGTAGRRAGGGLLALGFFALVAWLIWLAVQIIAAFTHGVSRAFDSIGVSPGNISEGLFWGIFATYGAVCLFLFSRIEVATESTSKQRRAFTLLGVAFVAAPLVILFLPVPGSATATLTSGACGSWLRPASQSTSSGTAYSWTYPPCATDLDGESRWALTIAAGGILIPVARMYFRDSRNKPPAPGAPADPSDKPPAPSSTSPDPSGD